MNFATLDEAMAARRSSHRTIHYIEGENDERALPFGEIYTRALGLLRHFQACGAVPGSEMILLLDRNEQFVDAFWACMLGNIIAVPLAPGVTDEHRLKLFRVLAKLQKPHLCTDQKIFTRLTGFAADNALTAEIERIRPATVFLDQLDDITQPGRLHAAKPDDIAFVQYSSGSTSAPKGVALTHRNLLTNIAAIAHGASLGETDIGLSWMPLTHDMGLIGFHLTLVLTDITHYLMSTTLFVRRPQLWLAKACEKRSTLLCSPNFGYRHFLKTFDADKGKEMDLSHVRILFNGAEPISVELCREFLDTLAPYGLLQAVMFPVYGLAEASLAVTFPKPGTGYQTITLARDALTVGQPIQLTAASAARAVTLVQVGRPVLGCEVRIASDANTPLPDNTIGHVLIRGENVSRGYYRDPESTRAVINSDGWLDTGDLGFQSDGILTITGRSKEILFVSGQNYYPHDIEAVIEKHAGIDLGKAAVCGVRPDHAATDDVLVFVLHRGELGDFITTVKNIRKCVNEHIGIVVSHVIPVSRIPKTTSGKIQRYLLADAYQKGEYEEVLAKLHVLVATSESSGAISEAQTEIERNLKEICDAFLTNKSIGMHDNIFELGTSSLMLAQIYQRIETIYPGQLEVTDFFDYPTVAELAKYLEKRLAAA
jgi:acyl-CoA synthetase (AMP-forming)/AMP-acid ligase II/acyl carrier protein